MFNILHLNFWDITGGASRAAYRLNLGLRGLGVNSQMLVQVKDGDNYFVSGPEGNMAKRLGKLGVHLDALPLQIYKNRPATQLSLNWLWNDLNRRVAPFSPDIIHLHWVCHGFVPVSALPKMKRPLIWTLHDCWPFTGGCHYPYECERYQEACGSCPQLGSKTNRDLSRWLCRQKAKHWGNLDLTVVTPSRWLGECAKSSALFREARIEVIPNGLDLKRFKPIEPLLAREILNLPLDKSLVLFGAINAINDRRKGFHLLQSALQKLIKSGLKDKLEFVVFGSSIPASPPDLGLKTHYLGHFHDDSSLALLYSAADVMVLPSTQEVFGQTATESLACGTPVVAFAIGGLKDIIDHHKNGYLAKPLDADDLAKGIEWILSSDSQDTQDLRRAARLKAEREYDISLIAHKYLRLYKELMN